MQNQNAIMAEKRTKTANKQTKKLVEKPTKGNDAKTKEAVETSGNKTAKKPQVSQNTNPFMDKYLEFYDDIKIPSRRYDW